MYGKITYLGSRNPWTDRYKILHVGCRPRGNHDCQFWWRSVKGFWCGSEGSIFGLFYWLASSPLKHSRTTVRVCDQYIEMTICQVLTFSGHLVYRIKCVACAQLSLGWWAWRHRTFNEVLRYVTHVANSDVMVMSYAIVKWFYLCTVEINTSENRYYENIEHWVNGRSAVKVRRRWASSSWTAFKRRKISNSPNYQRPNCRVTMVQPNRDVRYHSEFAFVVAMDGCG